MASLTTPPKKGTTVELLGLVAKPELNGCVGVIISNYDKETGRCGVQLEDGTGVNAKLSNIAILSSELKLERALKRLKEKGGSENDPDDDEDDEGKGGEEVVDIQEYLDELLAVGDARYELGQYDQAGGIFYRGYYATMQKSSVMNNPDAFPVALKMIQAWAESDQEHYLKMAHGMAQQTLMMRGCPSYIRLEMKELEKKMRRKGIEVEDMMEILRKNMAGM